MTEREQEIVESLNGGSTQVRALALMLLRRSPEEAVTEFVLEYNRTLREIREAEGR